jgi:DNA excision repair protein ERCC-2
VVVVGIGMPQVNRDTRQLQAWHQQRYGAGFEHTFLYPGMQKVDQALGRVVRRREDSGSALLIDPRYRQRQYRDLLPAWWEYQLWE